MGVCVCVCLRGWIFGAHLSVSLNRQFMCMNNVCINFSTVQREFSGILFFYSYEAAEYVGKVRGPAVVDWLAGKSCMPDGKVTLCKFLKEMLSSVCKLL